MCAYVLGYLVLEVYALCGWRQINLPGTIMIVSDEVGYIVNSSANLILQYRSDNWTIFETNTLFYGHDRCLIWLYVYFFPPLNFILWKYLKHLSKLSSHCLLQIITQYKIAKQGNILSFISTANWFKTNIFVISSSSSNFISRRIRQNTFRRHSISTISDAFLCRLSEKLSGSSSWQPLF